MTKTTMLLGNKRKKVNVKKRASYMPPHSKGRMQATLRCLNRIVLRSGVTTILVTMYERLRKYIAYRRLPPVPKNLADFTKDMLGFHPDPCEDLLAYETISYLFSQTDKGADNNKSRGSKSSDLNKLQKKIVKSGFDFVDAAKMFQVHPLRPAKAIAGRRQNVLEDIEKRRAIDTFGEIQICCPSCDHYSSWDYYHVTSFERLEKENDSNWLEEKAKVHSHVKKVGHGRYAIEIATVNNMHRASWNADKDRWKWQFPQYFSRWNKRRLHQQKYLELLSQVAVEDTFTWQEKEGNPFKGRHPEYLKLPV